MQASSGRQRRRIVLSVATAVVTGVVLTGYSALPQAKADLPSRALAGGDPAGGKDVPCGNPAVKLDRITQGFVNELAAQNPPPLSALSTKAARDVLNKLQAGPVEKLPADVTQKTIKGGPTGEVSLTILRPKGAKGTLPGLVYLHGGGWVLGNEMTHDRLVRQLADGADAAVVFVNYTPSPEARYPVAAEQAYTASKWVVEHGQEIGIDGTRLAVAGDSAGGDLTAAVTMLAKERGGVKFREQVLLYPVTDANFNTASYQRFAENCWLTKANMEYFWDQYAPSAADREKPPASPNKATTEQLRGLPPALVVTDSDVLRDGAVAYAGKLRAAGVPVEHLDYPETVHDFMMLNALRDSPSAKDAVARTGAALRKALHG
ncbi:alpha/beta hydrolase [Streptomyces bauhiniae]|uniref:Alpha/beta hydrolase n=1 Tax=Streptomyces bauhiniae TaxID=2340725 RepID=A0A7K3QX37_9ACTN|nr:alpha/beta hydrolase [Streptomyces bauhiniae]NEB94371.1 alpha/beta hydrolase [Streptomyces bauhiniae]